jgi:hypothetical protein
MKNDLLKIFQINSRENYNYFKLYIKKQQTFIMIKYNIEVKLMNIC